MSVPLPPIPDKLYFTIGEAAVLCAVKPHVLRFWEEEFRDLRPVKRRSNRRFYRKQEIELIREIRRLLHDEGYTIKGARSRLKELSGSKKRKEVTLDRASLREMRQDLEAVMEMLDRAGSNTSSPAL